MTRKAIGWATVTLAIKEYVDESNHTRIDISNTASGGIKGTTENRTLDFVERSHEDSMFGAVAGRSRWFSISDSSATSDIDSWLLEGWLEEGEGVGPKGESKIESRVKSTDKGWTVQQVWGFAVVDGKRYYVRRLVAKKGDKEVRIRIVYDFQGK